MKNRWLTLFILMALLGCAAWHATGLKRAVAGEYGGELGAVFEAQIKQNAGERPIIDLQNIPKDAYESGRFRIKLMPHMADVLPDKAITAGEPGYVVTGHAALDALNQIFSVIRYKPLFSALYDTDSRTSQYKERHRAWGFHLWFELTVPRDTNIPEIVKQYQALREVDIAEPEYKKRQVREVSGEKDGIMVATPQLNWSPDDPRLNEQWHYHNTGQHGGTPGADISLLQAWDIEKGSADVIVAIIDGGIDYEHEDLSGNMWENIGYNFVHNNDTIIAHNHGTHVAGTVAAVNNNAKGVAGVAGGSGWGDGVRLMSCQVFTDTGSGGFHLAPVYAADNGAAISQNSWGYTVPGAYEQAVLDAIDYFNANGGGEALDGGITIFAAGNSNSDDKWYPGYYAGAFSVAATNNQDKKSWYSNFGDWIDISAPGGETHELVQRGVLSTLNYNTYGFYQGTSMACPHASGVAALIVSLGYGQLSASQVADILRDTTDDHYSVNPGYSGQLGTGRLNALLALEETQTLIGPFGTLTGTVTTSGGDPLSGARVVAEGPVKRTETTDENGVYTILSLPVGTYDVTASKYGFYPQTIPNLEIQEDQTWTQDFVLNQAPMSQVTGQVTDNTTGWPLYARVGIDGYPDGSVWTDPVTGQYSVDLPDGGTYEFQVTAFVDGYDQLSRPVGPLAGNSTENFGMEADLIACSAPGYKRVGIFEEFESGNLPIGWSIVDNMGNGQVWRFDNPGGVGNWTGGTGLFADVNSDYYGWGNEQDTELHTPVIDFSSSSEVILEFKYDFFNIAATADVDVSNDGGNTWTNVWRRIASDYGPKTAVINISSYAAGQSQVVVRFRYYNASWDYWWQVDDVTIGSPACLVPSGGLVVGNVYDGNNQNPLVGALVESQDFVATTVATPDDASVDDAFYIIYSEAGNWSLTASSSGYGDRVENVIVPVGGTLGQNFQLLAGLLSSEPESLNVTVPLGQTMTEDINLHNLGSQSAEFYISARKGSGSQAWPGGYVYEKLQRLPEYDSLKTNTQGLFAPHKQETPTGLLSAGDVLASWPSYQTMSWGIGFNLDNEMVWVNDNSAGGGTGLNEEFTVEGNKTGTNFTPVFGGVWPGDMAYNPKTGMFWQVNVGGDNCIYEWDPAVPEATGNSICNSDWAWTSQRGLAYNALDDSFFIGGWNDSEVWHFDSSGATIDSCTLNLAISGLAYNWDEGLLFAMLNASPNTIKVINWANCSIIDTIVVSDGAFGNNQGAGLGINCDGNLWAANFATNMVYLVDSGVSANLCEGVAWLDVNPESGTIAVGGTGNVFVTFDAGVEEIVEAGEYHASLHILNDTPYGPLVVPLQMNVVDEIPTGYLQIYLSQEAVEAGVRWRIAGTVQWYYSGDTIEVPVGQYAIEFSSGWWPDEEVIVTVEEGETTVIEVELTASESFSEMMLLILDDE